MPADDRERNFEKAMARELRADQPNGLHCPDAETLAAFHERLLTPAEMAAQKSHIASCARCQEILATLEVTEAVSNEALDPVDVAAATLQEAPRAVSAAPVFSQREEAAAGGSKLREMPKQSYLRWAVPAGAIAAGLLLWVVMNGSFVRRTAQMKQTASAPVEVADNREQKKPQPVAPRSEAAALAEGALKSEADLEQAPAQEADKMSRDRLEKSGGFASRTTKSLPHGPAVFQNQTQNQIQNNANANDFFLPPAVAGNAPKTKEEAAKTAPAPPRPVAPAPASVDAGARKDAATLTESREVTAATPQVEMAPPAKEKKALDDETLKQQGFYVAGQKQMGGVMGRNAPELRDKRIATPNPKVFWMMTPDGALKKSANGGKSSSVQNLGEGIKAIAGSAPETKVCWVLAEGNLVFRTMDGGKHWLHVLTPSGSDFRTITAIDAQRATVADANGTVKLATVDGGATWAAAGAQ